MLKKLSIALLSTCMMGAAFAGSAFSDGQMCGGCRMIVKNYPGPKGVIVKTDGKTLTYCSTRCFACNVARMKSDSMQATDIQSVLVQDASLIDWNQPHATQDHLIDARTAWFVYGSSKTAVMGRSLAPFADKAKAQAFARQFGGTIHTYEELTPQLLGCKKRASPPSAR